MKKLAVLFVVSMMFGIIFCCAPAASAAEPEHEFTDQYDSDTMLADYSTAEIVAMYPEFSSYLAAELRSLHTDIDVRDYDFNNKDIGAIYFSVVCENPDIFYVFPISLETTSSFSTGKIVSIRPEFYFNIEDIPAKIKEFNAKVELMLSGIDMSWNDVTKARYLHDMLAQYTEYDTKYETISSSDYELYRVQMRIYTAFGAIVDNNAVCEGYAMAYRYLLSKAGVKSYYVQSVKKRHAWNLVEIGGKVYHVDITHDDPTYDNLGRVNHNNFLKSDNYINNDGDPEHVDWVTNLKASDTAYDNAWWNDVNTIIFRYNGYDYYVNQVYTSSIYAALTRRDISTGETEILKTLKTRWFVENEKDAFWERAFSYITSDGEYLYFNDTDSVYRMPVGSKIAEKIYTKPDSSTGDIYGIAFKTDGYLYTTIKNDPNAQDIIYKLGVQVQTPSVSDSSQDSSTGATEPSLGGATEPSSADITKPTETEPITALTTKETTPKPVTVKKSISTYIKRSVSLTLTPKANYKFTSSKKTVAKVSSKGVIKALKAGKTTITAKSATVVFKITVTVKNPKLNYTKKSIKNKKSFKLKVTGGSGKITFKTSNKKIATINSSGKVTAKKKGKATITVKVCGLTLKCKVTVK